MTTKINFDQTTTLIAHKKGEEYQVNAKISTSGTSIDATGAITGRHIFINRTGTVESASGSAIIVGSATLADSDTWVKVNTGGTLTSGGKGLLALSGGVTFNNVSSVQTKSTSVEFRGKHNIFENDGHMGSSAGSVLVSNGSYDNINNTATAGMSAQLDAIISKGFHTSISNSGTATINSAAGAGINSSGNSATIFNTSGISAYTYAIISSGKDAHIANQGGGSLSSNTGRGILSSGADATILNQATISTKRDAIVSTGSGAEIDNTASITSWIGVAIRSSGDHTVISNAASLGAKTTGILSSGDHSKITNNGYINADNVGIQVDGDSTSVLNTAQITAGAAIVVTGNGAKITNNNELTGTSSSHAAIDISATGTTTVTNKSTINASASGVVIEGGKGSEHIVNTGTLNGHVKLGAGDDVFSSLKGQVNGTVYGGTGDDTYIVGISLKIVEKAGQGTDTVQSMSTYTLGANLENLVLLGKGNMNGTGNSLANRLEGNTGNNYLTGLGGKDVFVFEKGGHHDVITDFTDHQDKIDLSGYTGIHKYTDLAGKFSQHGDDLVITFSSTDQLTLEHTHRSEITAADFIF